MNGFKKETQTKQSSQDLLESNWNKKSKEKEEEKKRKNKEWIGKFKK